MSPARLLELPTAPDRFLDCLRGHVLTLLGARRAGATICPSEAARWAAAQLDLEWQDLMRPLRDVAAELAEQGAIEVLQHGLPVDVRAARGPVRLRLKRAWD